MNFRLPHRGASDPADFAVKFVAARLLGFEKDMKICLTGVPATDRPGDTHAYFPALSACCGTLEYLSGLNAGRINPIGLKEILDFAEHLPAEYSADSVRVLYEAFRHPVAHRGIASGVWVDRNPAGKGRRLTWSITELKSRPAIDVVDHPGTLTSDPPWLCAYTHRAFIHLGSLWSDISNSAQLYMGKLATNKKMQTRFFKCMDQLYPR